MIITFCGHSDYTVSKEDEQKIISFLEETVGDTPAELFLGGYGSFDEFARRCAEQYRKTHPNVRLVFVTPYLTPEYQKNHLAYAHKLYDGVVYPELERTPAKFAVLKRNRWMVEQADLLVCYVERESGGAYTAMKYAKRLKKTIINLARGDGEVKK